MKDANVAVPPPASGKVTPSAPLPSQEMAPTQPSPEQVRQLRAPGRAVTVTAQLHQSQGLAGPDFDREDPLHAVDLGNLDFFSA